MELTERELDQLVYWGHFVQLRDDLSPSEQALHAKLRIELIYRQQERAERERAA